MTEPEDLQLLAASDELSQDGRPVDAATAWSLIHKRPPTSAEWPAICTSLLRLEREGLIRADPAMYLQLTDDGRSVVRPRNSE
jgi:Mn-dependent DtxR family transcriptional regulator